MKNFLLLALFVLGIIINPILAESAELDSILNLQISLKELSQANPDLLDQLISSNKYILLEGSVASITEIERSDANLILDIHLINGEWIGLDKVEGYKCIINISGPEWGDVFPERIPREVNSDLILLNNRIIVIGKVTDYVMDNSALVAVVEAQFIRKIQ